MVIRLTRTLDVKFPCSSITLHKFHLQICKPFPIVLKTDKDQFRGTYCIQNVGHTYPSNCLNHVLTGSIKEAIGDDCVTVLDCQLFAADGTHGHFDSRDVAVSNVQLGIDQLPYLEPTCQ